MSTRAPRARATSTSVAWSVAWSVALLGGDALDLASAKLRDLSEELEQWKAVTLSTGFSMAER